MPTAMESQPSVQQQYRRQQWSFVVGYAMLVMFVLFIFGAMGRSGPMFGAALIVFTGVMAAAVFRPAAGLGMAIPLTIVGDPVAMEWWPVTLNLSSRQSALYIADALTFRPIDLMMSMIIVAWFLNTKLGKGNKKIDYGPFALPMLVFTGSLFFGLVWGVGRGGDLRIALFEWGPMVLIPMVYLAAVNLFTSIEHYRRLLIGIIIAVVAEALHTMAVLREIRAVIREDFSPLEHTAVVPMNLLFLSLVAALWFGSGVRGKRPLLLLISLPTLFIFLDTQRRAGVVALIVGGITLAAILAVRNRRLFLQIIPLLLVITMAYTAALWNSESAIAFPAQAVKTIIAPGEASEKDQRSDLYRQVENANLQYTVRSSPVFGIGFGQPFLRPYYLPDISFFAFADYLPHNSIFWLWTKLGVAGFVSFLYMVAAGISSGVRCATRVRDPDQANLVAVMTAYLPMMFIVGYVEILFNPTVTTLFAAALAMSCTIGRLTKTDDMDFEEPTPSEKKPSKKRRPVARPTPELV